MQLSCGEHTDYGLLTFVNQEAHMTALQVKNAAGQWISAAPMPGTFVCNIGDMLKVSRGAGQQGAGCGACVDMSRLSCNTVQCTAQQGEYTS